MTKLKLKNIRCELCNSGEYILYRKNSGLDIVKCKKCGLIYVNPQPTFEYLKDFYNMRDNTREYQAEGWDFVPSYMHIIEKGLRKIAVFLDDTIKNKNRKLLDIGSGLNSQFEFMEKRGWEILGTELSKSYVKVAKRQGWNVVYGDMLKMDIREKEFDAITMMAVLEHLTNPEEYLKRCHKILKDEGVMVIEIPNLHYTLMNSTKLPLAEEMHLFHFTPRTIKMLMEKCGFEIIENRPVMDCGSENRGKHFAMVFWDKIAWVIYKTTGLHTNLQMAIYAKKSNKNQSGLKCKK